MTGQPPLSGLWTELSGTWMPLTVGPFTEPHALLTALNSRDAALMGGAHVPVRGQYLAAGDDLLVITGDLLRPAWRVVDVSVPVQVTLAYDSFVTLPAGHVRRAMQDYALLGATLACSSRPDLTDGAHLVWRAEMRVHVPRAAASGDLSPLLRLLTSHTRKAWWDTWHLRTQGVLRTAVAVSA